MNGETGVDAEYTRYQVVFECADGVFGHVVAVQMRWDQLDGHLVGE